MKQRKEQHALVALGFDSPADEERFLDALDAQGSVRVAGVERPDHAGPRVAVVLHLVYTARGANMNDVPRRLTSAAKSSGVAPKTIREPTGFAVTVERGNPEPTPAPGGTALDWSRASLNWSSGREQPDLWVPFIDHPNPDQQRALDDIFMLDGALPHNQHVSMSGDGIGVYGYLEERQADARERITRLLERAEARVTNT